MSAQRIFILGPSAAGKSTLARYIAQTQALPLLELDNLYWDDKNPAYGLKRDAQERDQRLSQAVAEPTWVMEGIYYAWTQTAMARADRIIFVDAPLWCRQWRILKRHFQRRAGGDGGIKKESLRSVWDLMAWDRRWDQRNRGPMEAQWAPYTAKLIRWDGRKDPSQFESFEETCPPS